MSSLERVHKVVGGVGATVWTWLNTQEVRGNAGPEGSPLKSIRQIASGTGLGASEVEGAVIKLAQARLVHKITPDGLVAA